jgi:hypothetical protein
MENSCSRGTSRKASLAVQGATGETRQSEKERVQSYVAYIYVYIYRTITLQLTTK